MAENDDSVNENSPEIKKLFKKFLVLLQTDEEDQKPLNKPSRAKFEDSNLAKAYHQNIGIILRGKDLVYPVKRYKNGDYGFYKHKPDRPFHRADLLKKHYKDAYIKKYPRDSEQAIKENLRYADARFAPNKSFFLDADKSGEYDQEINLWEPPYWRKVQLGMVPEPTNRTAPKGQLPKHCQKILTRMFDDETQRNIALSWEKGSLSGKMQKAFILIGDSRTGKSALIAMFASLHAPHASNKLTIEKFFEKFAWGDLVNKTFCGLNEGVLLESHLPTLKHFLTSGMFEAERKHEINEGDENHVSLMISSDKTDCLYNADQAILNRIVVPKVSNLAVDVGEEATLFDGTKEPFTKEDIDRIYNMYLGVKDKELAEMDRLAFADFLEAFDVSAIDFASPELTGFLDKNIGYKNFFNGLFGWEQVFISKILYAHLKTETPCRQVYIVPGNVIERLRKKACKDSDVVKELMKENKDTIVWDNLQSLGKKNKKILWGKQPDRNNRKSLVYEIQAEFVDSFLKDLQESDDTPPPEPPPSGADISDEPVVFFKPKKDVVENFSVCVPTTKTSEIIQEKLCYIDFEFHLHCKKPKLICCSLNADGVKEDFWVWQYQDNHNLKKRLHDLRKSSFTFVSFTDAEARCFYSLGLNPLDFKWLDAQILGLPFFHSSSKFGQYAGDNYWPEDGDIWMDNDADTSDEEIAKQEDKVVRKKAASLLGFYEFFTGKNTTTFDVNKEATRKLILSIKDGDQIDALAQQQILDYCAQDVDVLQELTEAQIIKWKEVSKKNTAEIIARFSHFSDFRVRMSDVSYYGLPLNKDVYTDLVTTYAQRIRKEQAALSLFYREEQTQYYKKDCKQGKKGAVKKLGRFVEDYKLLTSFINSKGLTENWPKTKTGKFSTDEKVLQQFQIIPEVLEFWLGRKRIKHIEFFKEEDGIPKIAKFVTKEGEMLLQHPEFGTFGTLTSRNAHKTKTFIMGMERKLRHELLGTEPGMIVLQPDFSAQEVWIAGALSGDQNQLRAAFEDPYIFFGQQAGMIPKDGNKKTHAAERDICKTVVLAAFYGMGFESLKNKLQLPEKKVRELQKKNKELYATYFEWRNEFLRMHKEEKYYELLDGWPLLDNKKPNGEYKTTTSMNFPIQGHGAVIMREVVNLFYKKRRLLPSEKIRLIYTLHDEFGVMCPKEFEQETKEFMKNIMANACRHYFPALEPPRVGFK